MGQDGAGKQEKNDPATKKSQSHYKESLVSW